MDMDLWRVMVKVQDAGGVDTEGGSVPDHKRRIDAGWEPEAESGIVCDHMDGTWVWQAHHGIHQQELRWHGWVPCYYWAPGKSSLPIPPSLLAAMP